MDIIPETSPNTVHESSSQKPLEVYPNPVADVLHLRNLSGEKVEYRIFNMLGQEVVSGFTSGTISVSALDEGLYFLQVNGENCRKTAKLIVE